MGRKIKRFNQSSLIKRRIRDAKDHIESALLILRNELDQNYALYADAMKKLNYLMNKIYENKIG